MSKVLRREKSPLIQSDYNLFKSLKLALYISWKTFSVCLITFYETVKFYEYNTCGNAEKTINISMILCLDFDWLSNISW